MAEFFEWALQATAENASKASERSRVDRLRAAADAAGLCTGAFFLVWVLSVASRMSDPEATFSIVGAVCLSLLFLIVYAALLWWRGNREKWGLVILFCAPLLYTLLLVLPDLVLTIFLGGPFIDLGMVIFLFFEISIAVWTPALIFRGLAIGIRFALSKFRPSNTPSER